MLGLWIPELVVHGIRAGTSKSSDLTLTLHIFYNSVTPVGHLHTKPDVSSIFSLVILVWAFRVLKAKNVVLLGFMESMDGFHSSESGLKNIWRNLYTVVVDLMLNEYLSCILLQIKY